MKEKTKHSEEQKNRTIKLLASLLALLILSVNASAQNGASVFGRITQDKQPLKNVILQLKNLEDSSKIREAATDASGNYRFADVPRGKYELTVASQNSQRRQRVWKIEIESQSIQFDITDFVGTPQVVGEVIIIASGTDQPIDAVSKSVSVISNQELQDRNEITVIDALRTVPGVRVGQSGGFGRLAAIKIRGLRNQDTAVLIDGQRFRDPAAITGDASSFLSDLQFTGTERIEVLRGSGSSLYGTNAIGGVFNVQSADFRPDFRGSLLAEAGGMGEFRGRAGFGGALGDKAFYNLGLAHTNFSKGVDGRDAARNTSGKASAQYNLNRYAQLTGRFYFSDAFAQLNSNPDTIGALPSSGIVEARALSRSELRRFESRTARNLLNIGDATFIPDANDPDASQASRFYNFNVALDGLINSLANYRVSYQNLATRRKNINGPAGLGFQPFGVTSRGDFDGRVQTLQARSDVTLRSNLLTFGYEFEHERFGNDNFSYAGAIDYAKAADNAVDARQTSNTFFVQDQVQAFDRRLQLSGAFRTQFFSLKTPVFTPSSNPPYRNLTLNNPPNAYTADGSIAYFFRSTGTKLRGHVGNGYRVPSLYERFGTYFDNFFANNFVALGAPNLKPERSIAFDTGVDQSFQNNRVRLSATYFYTKLTDIINFGQLPQPDLANRFSGYRNAKGGIARGGELSAEFAPTNSTNVFASYTFTKSLQREAQISGSGILQTLGVPDHAFTLVLTQRLYDRLTLNFDFVATSSYLGSIFSNTNFQTRVYRFNGQRRGDLTASYEIPTANDKLRVRLFGTIENIFNRDYYENGFRNARAQGRGGVALNF